MIAKLREKGWVSRNECLRMYPAIARLAARIDNLKEMGWNVDGKRDPFGGNDYVYFLVSEPAPKQLTL